MGTWLRRSTAVSISALRPGEEVRGVFACTRKDRLNTRTGSPYLALELRDRTRHDPRARIPRRRRARRPVRARRPRARVRAGRALPRRAGAGGRRHRARSRLGGRSAEDPARFLPSAYRDLDELDGFLEHLAGEVYDRRYRSLLERAARRQRAARRVAPRAVHARRPPRVPRRPARAHRRGGHARARALPAAPAAELRPAADRGASSTTSAARASSPTAPRSA